MTRKKLKLSSHYIYEGENNDSEDGLVTEIAHYDENEKISPKHFYRENTSEKKKKNIVNNDEGYTVEEFRNNENRKFIDKVITSYDSKGNIKEFSCFKQDGTLDLKDVYDYKFDSIGNWIEQIQNHWVIGWGEFKLVPLTITRRKIDYFDEKNEKSTNKVQLCQ